MFDTYQKLSFLKRKKVFYSIFFNKKIILQFDTLLYFWPKSKSEAKFQLEYLFSILKKKLIFL